MADPPASRRRLDARINDLPLKTLRNILSFLSAREAVRACELSRRWRDLWKSTPRINADINDFEDEGYSGEQSEVLFNRFMNRFLEARDPVPLQEFRLCCSVEHYVFKDVSEDNEEDQSADVSEHDEEAQSSDVSEDEDGEEAQSSDVSKDREEAQSSDVTEDREEAQSADVSVDDEQERSADPNKWIRYALRHNASVISVVTQNSSRLYPAPAMFTSDNLKSLELRTAILMQGFFGQLQNGCPKLKHLILYDCKIVDTEVSSQTLEALALLPDEVCFHPDLQATISAPSLISLILHDPYGARLPLLRNMASLEEASIIISQHFEAIDAPDITQFLDGLSRVRRLRFDYNHRQLTMENNNQWCPAFTNLTDLTLHEWCVHGDFYALIVFLQKSPKLKDLRLILKEPGDEPAIIGALEERSFTCSQLESVEIICPYGCSLLPKVHTFLLDGGITPDKIHIKHRPPLQAAPGILAF